MHSRPILHGLQSEQSHDPFINLIQSTSKHTILPSAKCNAMGALCENTLYHARFAQPSLPSPLRRPSRTNPAYRSPCRARFSIRQPLLLLHALHARTARPVYGARQLSRNAVESHSTLGRLHAARATPVSYTHLRAHET